VISGNENKFFIYNNPNFKEVVVTGILKSYATCMISDNYKLKNYVSAIIEALVIPNNFKQVLNHFFDTFVSVASARAQNTDFNIHYLQGIISRLIKNTPNMKKKYLQVLQLVDVMSLLYFPMGHALHESAKTSVYVPGRQNSHLQGSFFCTKLISVLTPLHFENFPAGQLLQIASSPTIAE